MTSSRDSLKPITRKTVLPMSTGQTRLWYLSSVLDPSYTYNDQLEVRINGTLDVGILERCFHLLIERHETLRTAFSETQEGALIQTILEPFTIDIPLRTLGDSHMDNGALEREIDRVCLEEGQAQYDLTTGKLFRVCLFQLSDQHQLLLFSFHHIILGGRSLTQLLEELDTTYIAESKGIQVETAKKITQCQDYAYWEKSWMESDEFSQRLNYWRAHHKGNPPSLHFPFDYPRSTPEKNYGEWEYIKLSKELTEELSQLGKQENVSLFTILLASYKILLMRYSGQLDISVGTVVANRSLPETKKILGFLAETVILRSKVNGNTTFKEFLTALRKMTTDVFYNQTVPFSKLTDIIRQENNASVSPLCQAALVYKSIPYNHSKLAGLPIEHPRLRSLRIAKFDMTLSLEIVEQRLKGYFEYNTDLISASSAKRFLLHFELLLESIVKAPDRCISSFSFLSDGEEKKIVEEFNADSASPAVELCTHKLFEQQAKKTPNAIAVCYDGRQLTYEALNAQSNKLAHYLMSRGVEPESRVGLCIERSLEMVIGILGILKAGGAYVPIDPHIPVERMNYLLDDSNIQLLVTQEDLQEKFQGTETATNKCIYLNQHWPQIDQCNIENPPGQALPDNIAYVIYTSGSTGKPKGTLITHANVVRLLTTTQAQFQFNQDDVWTFFHSFAFDFSVWELWGALCFGGRLIVVPYWLSRDPEAFCNLVYKEGITVLNQTPSAFNQFIAADQDSGFKPEQLSLRYIIFGGEALEMKSLRPWFRRHNPLSPQLINMYGITETTVHVTEYLIEPANADSPRSTIGKPLSDLQSYILDEYLRIVPIGVPGELYIGGRGLARGYHNRAGLTADRFTPNPFCKNAGSRLYRTGDLARYQADGNLEYIGRIDHQVKIRGFRIELGEIEAVLAEQPGVLQAIVQVHGRTNDTKNINLAAYLVCEKPCSRDKAQLQDDIRNGIKARLPDYMIPSFIIILDKLPLTTNGKLDREALPEPSNAIIQPQQYLPPRTEIEQQLTTIWSDVLGIEANQIGRHANFFELGGDSILSLQIITRAKKLGLHISPKQLFKYPTISTLASIVTTTPTLEAEQGPVVGDLPLLPIQHWFFECVNIDLDHYNQAYLLKVPGRIKENTLTQAMQALVVHHDALRVRFNHTNTGWNQKLITGTPDVSITHIDLSCLSVEKQRLSLKEESSKLQKSLSIEKGPLLNLGLFHMGVGLPSRLLIVIHHMAVDGVSWRILLEDLATVYQQLDANDNVKLPLKTTSYKSWSNHLKSYSQSENLFSELEYWKGLSLHTPGSIPYDTQSTTEANSIASSEVHTVVLSEKNTHSILQDVHGAYNTHINDVLLTAVALAFKQWTNEDGIFIDLEGHGREDIFDNVDLSRTVGWFTSIYPVYLTLESVLDLGASLKSIKEQLQQIPNRGIGYGVLRYCTENPLASTILKKIPNAKISFNYLGQFDQAIDSQPLFQWADEAVGETHSKHQLRTHDIDILGFVVKSRLHLNITYSRAHFNANTMVNVGNNLLGALRQLIVHCSSPDSHGYTPSDFTDADMTPDELDEFMNNLGDGQ